MNIDKIDASINYGCLDKIQQRNRTLNPGDKIGEGFGGVVYQDKDDPHKVIKDIRLDNSSDIDEATRECELFRAYYGVNLRILYGKKIIVIYTWISSRETRLIK